jgi:hypothetical protein
MDEKHVWTTDTIRVLKQARLLGRSDKIPHGQLPSDLGKLLPVGSKRVVIFKKKKETDEARRLEAALSAFGLAGFCFTNEGYTLVFVSRDAERIASLSTFMIDVIPCGALDEERPAGPVTTA